MGYNESALKNQIERELDKKLMSLGFLRGESPQQKITVILNYTELGRMAIEQHAPLTKVASKIIENKVKDLDIVEYVKEAFGYYEDLNWLEIDINNTDCYGKDIQKINVFVDFNIHRKLRVISAIQDNMDVHKEFNVVSTIPNYFLFYEMDNRDKQRAVILDKFVLSILKIVASGKYNNFSEAVTAILENKLANFDIVRYVKNAFSNENWLDVEVDNTAYDLYDRIYNNPSNNNFHYPNKQSIDLNIDSDTHKKLRIISAIQDIPFDRLVNLIIGFDIGAYEKNEILDVLKECTWYYDNIEKLKLHIKRI